MDDFSKYNNNDNGERGEITKRSGKDLILDYLKKNGPKTVSELSKKLFLSRQIIHRHINSLLEDDFISKTGKSPKVFYSVIEDNFGKNTEQKFDIDKEYLAILEENFLTISPEGRKLIGLDGFVYWCKQRDFDVYQKVSEYVEIFKKYEKLKIEGFLDGYNKLGNSFKKVCLNKLFYIDFYVWEVFGKTKLGQLLLYSKQSQDRRMIAELAESVRGKILDFIERENIDAVGFIPPTVRREVQFMKVLEETLNISLPSINLVKIKTEVSVPQKTLNKLEDRIKNADATIEVGETRRFKKILLIDDSVGSGATLNQTACKLKDRNIAGEVIGLAITGSLKGFDVISEV